MADEINPASERPRNFFSSLLVLVSLQKEVSTELSNPIPVVPLADKPWFTQAEWRAWRNISKAEHMRMKKKGLAPAEMEIAGKKRMTRITREEDEAWAARILRAAADHKQKQVSAE